MTTGIKKQISLLWFCQLTIIAALEMSNPFLPIYIAKLDGYGIFSAGAWNISVYLAPLLSAMIFAPIWGYLGDKFGYKSMLLRATLSLAMIQLLLYFVDSLIVFVILRFVQGAIAGFIAASQSYAAAVVKNEYRGRTLARLQSATAVGIALGPLMGGLFGSFFDYRWLFLLSAVISTIVLIFLNKKLCTDIPRVKLKAQAKKSIHKLFKLSRMNVYFSIIFTSIFLSQTAKFLPQSFFSIYVADYFSVNPFVIGLLYATPAFSLLLIASPLGQFFDNIVKKSRRRYFFASGYFVLLFSMAAIAVYVHGFTRDMSTLIAARIVWGIAIAGILPCLFGLVCRYKSTRNYGSLIGYCNTFSKFGNLSGVFIGGLLYQSIGMIDVFYVAVGMYILLLISYLLLMYKNDNKKQTMSLVY